jgi:hypothetical protein
MVTMFGWFNAEAERASRSKRSIDRHPVQVMANHLDGDGASRRVSRAGTAHATAPAEQGSHGQGGVG